MGRAFRELGIQWIAAHSPQAKGRIERCFGTLQDRLVKGLRKAGARTQEEANQYLEQEFLKEWNERFTVPSASVADAPLGGAARQTLRASDASSAARSAVSIAVA